MTPTETKPKPRIIWGYRCIACHEWEDVFADNEKCAACDPGKRQVRGGADGK